MHIGYKNKVHSLKNRNVVFREEIKLPTSRESGRGGLLSQVISIYMLNLADQHSSRHLGWPLSLHGLKSWLIAEALPRSMRIVSTPARRYGSSNFSGRDSMGGERQIAHLLLRTDVSMYYKPQFSFRSLT